MSWPSWSKEMVRTDGDHSGWALLHRFTLLYHLIGGSVNPGRRTWKVSPCLEYQIRNYEMRTQPSRYIVELGLGSLGPGISQCSRSGVHETNQEDPYWNQSLQLTQVNWRHARFGQALVLSSCYRLGSCTWRWNSLAIIPSADDTVVVSPGTYSPQ